MAKSEFHTQKGYEMLQKSQLSAAAEDYLEMICRLSSQDGSVRVTSLAFALNVSPPAASKMANHLSETGHVIFEKYGYIKPTKIGFEKGKYLIKRHDAVNGLLCLINNTGNELEETEKIEHFLSKRTTENILRFLTNVGYNAGQH